MPQCSSFAPPCALPTPQHPIARRRPAPPQHNNKHRLHTIITRHTLLEGEDPPLPLLAPSLCSARTARAGAAGRLLWGPAVSCRGLFPPCSHQAPNNYLITIPPKSLWPLSPSPGPPPLALLFNKSWHTRNPTPAANTIILRPPLLLSPGRLEPLLPCPALPLLSPRRLSPLLPDALFSTVFQTKPPLLACFSNTVVFLSSALSPTTTATNTQQHTQQHTTNTLLHITPAQTLPDCLPTLPSQVPRPPCSSCHNHHRNHHRRQCLTLGAFP